MKLSTFLSASLLLSAFAAGCAAESNSGPVVDETQTDEAGEALSRAAVKGVYVRTVHAPSCSIASTIELRANGTFTANLDYYGPTVLCAEVLAAPLNGSYSLNRRSNVVTFRVARSRTVFTLSFARNELSRVTGSAANRALFQGGFRKLAADECLNDAGCGAAEVCQHAFYATDPGAPIDDGGILVGSADAGSSGGSPSSDAGAPPSGPVDAGSGGGASDGGSPIDPPFVFPAVSTGICIPRAPEPSPIVCGGIAGFECPEDMYCQNLATSPDAAGVCRPSPGFVCTLEYAPVCGSNGITYGNACEAGRIPGVHIAHDGVCVSAPRP